MSKSGQENLKVKFKTAADDAPEVVLKTADRDLHISLPLAPAEDSEEPDSPLVRKPDQHGPIVVCSIVAVPKLESTTPVDPETDNIGIYRTGTSSHFWPMTILMVALTLLCCNIGSIYSIRADIQENLGETIYNFAAGKPRTLAARLNNINTMASDLSKLGFEQAALDHYIRARELIKSSNPHGDIRFEEEHIGGCLFRLKKYPEAVAALERAIAAIKERGFEPEPSLYRALSTDREYENEAD